MTKTVKELKICIIGAGVFGSLPLQHVSNRTDLTASDDTGMGGLTCALALAKEGFKNIHVYETASDLGFVGAGIQLAPNMARILDRLGVWADIEKEAVNIKDTVIKREMIFPCFATEVSG